MDKKPLIVVAAVLAVGVAVVLVNRPQGTDSDSHATSRISTGEFDTLAADRKLVIFCGTSMSPAAERIASEFQDRYGIAVQFEFGGSSVLLTRLKLTEEADLYLCHDPYAEMLGEAGLLSRYETVGHLEPIIITPPGNPASITGITDLARDGLRVVLPDGRISTAGRLIAEALTELGIHDEVRRNLVAEHRGHNDVAQTLLAGQADVAMVWNFITHHYRGRIETVAAGVALPETRVTLCLLNYASDTEAAEKFIELARSDFGQQVFRSMGYYRSAPPTPHDDAGQVEVPVEP